MTHDWEKVFPGDILNQVLPLNLSLNKDAVIKFLKVLPYAKMESFLCVPRNL